MVVTGSGDSLHMSRAASVEHVALYIDYYVGRIVERREHGAMLSASYKEVELMEQSQVRMRHSRRLLNMSKSISVRASNSLPRSLIVTRDTR